MRLDVGACVIPTCIRTNILGAQYSLQQYNCSWSGCICISANVLWIFEVVLLFLQLLFLLNTCCCCHCLLLAAATALALSVVCLFSAAKAQAQSEGSR
jgi:hypothetical protein